MMDLSWSHTLLFLIVALVVVGPKDLPKLMRKIGRWTAKAREMADQFRKSFDEMSRETELAELRAEIDALRSHGPLGDVERELSSQSILPAEYLPRPDTETVPQARRSEGVAAPSQ